ncbi:KxYKxGKxW signal peptide domain-containing protein [Leuconostoc citreum]|uniref:KxYKxGKxW signal peptide domain-containing protein n=1 Tax=Leuconostoc citreum TaxID=33964 RepID=UPI0032E04485
MPTKKYKLYKDGKSLVIGAIAVAGIVTTTGVNNVSADTTSTGDKQAVVANSSEATSQSSVGTATEVSKQADSANNATSTNTEANKPAETVKSNVPTSVPSGTTQDKAKEAVDKAQGTVKDSASEAEKSGVEVTQKPTQDVTINQNNAVDETNKVLNDLNKQDQTIKQATATQKADEQAKNQADTQRDEANKKGQADLGQATNGLKNEVNQAKQSGVGVTEKTEKVTPKYKDTKGLTGADLLEAMSHNISEYNKAIEGAVSKETQDTKTIQALRQQRDKEMAAYRNEVARVNKVNTDRKNAYDKLVLDRETAIKAAIAKGDQHYTGTYDLNGYYGGFLNGKVHYDYTYHWDNDKGTFIITKVDIRFDSATPDKKGAGFWDTVYVQGPKYTIPQDSDKGYIQGGADVKENGNTLWEQIKDPKYGVLFFLSQNNRTGEVVVHQNNSAGVPFEAVQLPNGDFEIARFVSRNRQGNPGIHNSEYANWIVGNKVVINPNIPVVPTPPTYEKEPVEPASLQTTATYYEVLELPKADVIVPQKVSFNLYNIKTTPAPEKPVTPVTPVTPETPVTPAPVPTATPAPKPDVPVEKASLLPKTGTNQTNNNVATLGALASIASLGLLGTMRKKFKQTK